VLGAVVDNLESAEPRLVDLVDRLRPLVASGRRTEARELLQTALAALPANRAVDCRDVIDAVIEALSADG
jgi:hypothetical protein